MINNLTAWYVGAGLTAYLIGAIPCGFIIARWRGVDIRKVGSGNVGATNVFRSVGRGWGVLTFLADAGKGFFPVRLAPWLMGWCAGIEPPPALAVLCAVCAVAGHNWPVYLRFKGGKGVATSAGALLAIAPAPMGVGLLAWGLVFALTRYVSVASISAAAATVAAAWIMRLDYVTATALSLLGVVIIWRHRSNIHRLRQGTELRIGRAGRSSDKSR